jgi:hypothetical protein
MCNRKCINKSALKPNIFVSRQSYIMFSLNNEVVTLILNVRQLPASTSILNKILIQQKYLRHRLLAVFFKKGKVDNFKIGNVHAT